MSGETIFKEYEKVEGMEGELKFRIFFNKETINYSTYKPCKIGYYVSMQPMKVERKKNMIVENYTAFTGYSDLLLEVNRQSKNRLLQAVEIYKQNKQEYINRFKK